MTIYTYSSIDEVTAFTRHLLAGEAGFNSTTRPTITELRKFIERASNVLNTALAGEGLTVPITQQVAKSACDDWVTSRAAGYVEMTQRGVGYSDDEGSRVGRLLGGMGKDAREFAADNRLGLIRLGVTVGQSKADGLAFTGMDAQSERADPDDSSLAQPSFSRNLFNYPGAGGTLTDDEDCD